MDFGKHFGTDESLELEGVEIEVEEGLFLRIARMGNKRYHEALRKKCERYRYQTRKTTIPDDVYQTLKKEAMGEHILLGWRGDNVTDDGKPITYSPENAVAMLKKYKDFCMVVEVLASNQENFKKHYEEEARGN